MELREKFLNANIPYDDIDKEMIELIDILNFDLGLKTEYCCYGHENGEETYIVFDKSVNDEEIYSLAKFLLESKRETCVNNAISLGDNFGEFNKCVRSDDDGGLATNWNYNFPKLYNRNDISMYEDTKRNHMARILEDLRDYKELQSK